MARPKIGYHIDGEPVIGTTTVCGMLAKPALVGWASKLCTEVSWRAGKAGEPLPKWTDICYGTRDEAASAGTLVHESFEAHLRGQPPVEFDDTEVGNAARQGYENAVHWLESSGLRVEPYEKPLVSMQFRFGGTPDAIMHGGGVSLGDWKTGGVYAEMLLQMAAYRQLLTECAGVEVVGVHLVRFSRECGDFSHHFFGDDLLDVGWEVFRRLLDIHPLLKQIEGRVK